MTITITPNSKPIEINIDSDGISGIDGIIAIACLSGIGDLDEDFITSLVVYRFNIGSSEYHEVFLAGDNLIGVFHEAEDGDESWFNRVYIINEWSKVSGKYDVYSYDDMKAAFDCDGFSAGVFYSEARGDFECTNYVFDLLCPYLQDEEDA